MYKAIICDDEESVRQALINHFDWAGHGIEVIGTFEDGVPALEFTYANEVDLVITDVRMIHMDGIALAKKVLEYCPNIKIVFISGYADVEYMKDALKMEAVDYILKSIDLDELAAVINKVVKTLDKQRSDKKVMEEMAEKLEQSMPLLRERRLCALLKDNGENEEEIAESISVLGIPLNSRTRYVVLVLCLQTESKWSAMRSMTEKERILFDMSIEVLFGRVLSECGASVIFKEHAFEYIAVLSVEQGDYEEKLLSAAGQLQVCIKNEMNQEVLIGISEPFLGLCNMRVAYMNACEAISRHFLIGKGIPISIKKYEDDSNGRSLREQAEKEICGNISNGDITAVQTALERAVAGAKTMLDENEQQNFMMFLLMIPTRLMTNMRAENMGPYVSQRKLIVQFLQCGSLNEQETMLASVYEKLTIHLSQISTPHTNSIVKRVQEIIASRYMEQLSVTGLAEEVCLTSTYLCVLFKQAAGRTINEYITLERLNRAKEFLAETNIRLYDVCYKVGYLSPSYFSRLFKKHTGLTPGEYRENAMQKSGVVSLNETDRGAEQT